MMAIIGLGFFLQVISAAIVCFVGLLAMTDYCYEEDVPLLKRVLFIGLALNSIGFAIVILGAR